MSECSECELNVRAGHATDCSHHPVNRVGRVRVNAALASWNNWGDETVSPDERMALAILAADRAKKVIKADPAMPVFVAEQSLDIPGRGVVHVGLFPEGCAGVNTFVRVNGKPRKIAVIEYQRTNMGGLRPGDRVALIFHAERDE